MYRIYLQTYSYILDRLKLQLQLQNLKSHPNDAHVPNHRVNAPPRTISCVSSWLVTVRICTYPSIYMMCLPAFVPIGRRSLSQASTCSPQSTTYVGTQCCPHLRVSALLCAPPFPLILTKARPTRPLPIPAYPRLSPSACPPMYPCRLVTWDWPSILAIVAVAHLSSGVPIDLLCVLMCLRP